MATQVKRRRGTDSDHFVFVGAPGEITVNTTTNRAHVHDGTRLGGWPTQRLDQPTRYAAPADQAARLALPIYPDLTFARQGDTGIFWVLQAAVNPAISGNWVQFGVDAYTKTQNDALLAAKADLVAGKVPLSQLPDFATAGRTTVVANEAARLAQSTYSGLTLTLQSDTGDTWALNPGADPSVSGNWQKVGTAAVNVVSVFGRTGMVTAQAGDYSADLISYSGTVAASDVKAAIDSLAASVASGLTTLNGTAGDIVVSGSGSSRTIVSAVQTGVAGSYTNPSVTVNTAGKITAIASGSVVPAAGSTTPALVGTTAAAAGSATTYMRSDAQLELAAVGTAGTYAYPQSIVTNAKGQVTSITAGSAPTGVVSVTAVVNGGLRVGGTSSAITLDIYGGNLNISTAPGATGTINRLMFTAAGAPYVVAEVNAIKGWTAASTIAGSEFIAVSNSTAAASITIDNLFTGRTLSGPTITGTATLQGATLAGGTGVTLSGTLTVQGATIAAGTGVTLTGTLNGGTLAGPLLTAPRFQGYFEAAVASVTVSGTTTLSAFSNGNDRRLLMTASATVNVPDPAPASGNLAIWAITVTQNGTGGFTPTFSVPSGQTIINPATTASGAGAQTIAAPGIRTGANMVTVYHLKKYNGSAEWTIIQAA